MWSRHNRSRMLAGDWDSGHQPSTLSHMSTFLRGLPERIWWVTLILTGFAIITQLGLAYARSSSTSLEMLAAEFALTLVLLALPVWIAWRARQDHSLWYACGALVLFVAMAKIFFF
jgi:hypothetical protein